MIFRFLLLAMAGLLTGCGFAPTHQTADRLELPTIPDLDFLVVPVMLNGAGPFRFVVDSGADLPVMTTDVALAAKIDLHGGVDVLTPAGEFQIISGRIARLQIGGFTASDVHAGVAPNAYLAAFRHTHHIDGLLGIGVFRHQLLEMDFPNRRVAVERWGDPRLRDVPFVSYEGPRILVLPTVAGEPAPAILDTGNSFGFNFPRAASYPLAVPLTWDPTGFAAVGSTAAVHSQIGQLRGEIRLGPAVWTDPTIRLQTDSTLGIIGVESLGQLDLVFDARDRRIYFLPLGSNSPVPSVDRSLPARQ